MGLFRFEIRQSAMIQWLKRDQDLGGSFNVQRTPSVILYIHAKKCIIYKNKVF